MPKLYDYDVHGVRTVFAPDGTGAEGGCAASPLQTCGSAFGNPRGYAGLVLSSATGLYDMRARRYDPRLRIFLSPDPLGYVDGYDVWLYVGGDPLNLFDPWGLSWRGGKAEKGFNHSIVGPSLMMMMRNKIPGVMCSTSPALCNASHKLGANANVAAALGGGFSPGTIGTLGTIMSGGKVKVGFMIMMAPASGASGALAAGLAGADFSDTVVTQGVEAATTAAAIDLGISVLSHGVLKGAGKLFKGSGKKAAKAGGGQAASDVVSSGASGGPGPAHNAANYAKLKDHLRQLEKYGQGGSKELESGRIRYFGKIQPARKAGPLAGRRMVREWDPATGQKRTWHETVDHQGRVRQVRPDEAATGGSKTHYTFDENGDYTGSW